MVTCFDGLLPITSYDRFITRSGDISTTIVPMATELGSIKSFRALITVHMAPKLGRMVTYHEKLPSIKSHDPFITWSCLITWHTKGISTITIPITTKLGKVVIHHEKLQFIKLLDPSITLSWFCKVTWHDKCFISPLALDQWLSKMARWLTVMGFHW